MKKFFQCSDIKSTNPAQTRNIRMVKTTFDRVLWKLRKGLDSVVCKQAMAQLVRTSGQACS